MGLLADYAECYGHVPAPESPWTLFIGLLRQIGKFEARAYLRSIDGSAFAQPSNEGTGAKLLLRQELVKRAGYH